MKQHNLKRKTRTFLFLRYFINSLECLISVDCETMTG